LQAPNANAKIIAIAGTISILIIIGFDVATKITIEKLYCENSFTIANKSSYQKGGSNM
jgi:hypothetical protein